MDVVVVEKDGKIIGSLSVLRASHFEGLWVEPKYRGNAGIMRALIRKGTSIARLRGESWVFGGAADYRMRNFAERLGGIKIPMDLYVMGLEVSGCPQQPSAQVSENSRKTFPLEAVCQQQ
jgi:predicted N-acetyltransferase YhbS